MRHMEVIAKVPNSTAALIYPILCDFEQYPKYSDAVRTVSTSIVDGERTISSWEVNFQQGILRWTEEDSFSPEAYTIHFQQIEGDVDDFYGEWTLRDVDEGCLMRFTADFDLGIPSLSDILEPIAKQALRDNICSILKGLLGESVEFLSEDETSRSGSSLGDNLASITV